jgi:hypothetical protein
VPQSKRANVFKEIVRWLVIQEKRATHRTVRQDIRLEITDGGTRCLLA